MMRVPPPTPCTNPLGRETFPHKFQVGSHATASRETVRLFKMRGCHLNRLAALRPKINYQLGVLLPRNLFGCGSKPFWYHFGVGAPPILEPILVVGLNRMFTGVGYGFCPPIWVCVFWMQRGTIICLEAKPSEVAPRKVWHRPCSACRTFPRSSHRPDCS